MKLIMIISFLLLITFVVGCAPNVSKYQYISLEGVPSIAVTKSEMPKLKRLYRASPIPLAYLLERKNYALKFEIDDQLYMPNIAITAFGIQGEEKLLLRPQRLRKHMDSDKGKCLPFYQVHDEAIIKLVVPNCEIGDYEMIISFDVIKHAETIGVEDISFQLKSNGIYYVIDGI